MPLTTQQFLDVVLSFFDMKRLETDQCVEVDRVVTFKPMACLQVARLADWSFLIRTATMAKADAVNSYEDENGIVRYTPFKSFRYGFRLPEGFIKLLYINGQYNIGFAVKGNVVYCDVENPSIDYISSDSSDAPVDFDYLCAYRTAIEISQFLDTQGTAMEKARNLFSLSLQTMIDSDSQNKRWQNPDPSQFVF